MNKLIKSKYMLGVLGLFLTLIATNLYAGDDLFIGASIDVTGPTSDAGLPYAKGIEDYCRWANETKIIKDHNLNCVIKDDAYRNDVSKRNFEEFLDEDILIFLSYATGANLMLKSDVEEEGVPTIPASTYSGIEKDSKYFFLPISTYGEQLTALSEYIIKHHPGPGKPKVAAFVHPSAFGRAPIDVLKKAISLGLGIELVEMVEHAKGLDNTAMLKRLNSKGVQYILSQTVQSYMAVLLKDAHRLNMSAQKFGEKGKFTFLGAHYTGGNDLILLAGNASENYYWTTSYSLTSKVTEGTKFVVSLAKKYDRNDKMTNSHNYTAGILAAQIAIEAIRRTQVAGEDIDRESIKNTLRKMNGSNSYFANTTVGKITFSPTDNSGVDALQLYQVSNGVFQYVGEPFTSEFFKKLK